ncbi:succinylglutamate desuccinylase/aspartoacylase family protein [Patescibacteria group bacterium]
MLKIIGDSIWQTKAQTPGPRVVILGGIHGNELTGIEVIKKLKNQIEANELVLERGELTLALGNLEAIKLNKRYTPDGQDLNRQFYQEHLDGPIESFYESKRAHELFPILQGVDVCLDLHATNKPASPFVACARTGPRHNMLIERLQVNKVLIDPNYYLGGQAVTTDEYVFNHGGVGVCFETGYVKDTSRISQVYEMVLDILSDQKMISARTEDDRNSDFDLFEIYKRVVLTDSGFKFAPNCGQENFEPFVTGQILGYHGQAAVVADQDGVIVFPKIKEHWRLNQPICYFAKCLLKK